MHHLNCFKTINASGSGLKKGTNKNILNKMNINKARKNTNRVKNDRRSAYNTSVSDF